MIDRAKIIEAYPIADFIRKEGVELKQKGKEMIGLCPFHQDNNPSMHVNTEKQTYYCFTCGAGGSVIDWLMQMKGIGIKDAMYELAQEAGISDEPRQETTYRYKDEYGRDVMQVKRIQDGRKKRFVQSHNEGGKQLPGIKGVKRVLFRCDKWHDKPEIEICEGEKCVAAFEAMGYHATCNPGGANGWLDSYASYLKDKHVTIWPDRDAAGEKWCDAVMASLGEIPASIRICRVPAPYNDVADIAIAKGVEMGCDVLGEIADKTPRIERGHDLPLYSADDLMGIYRKEVCSEKPIRMDLGLWLPELRNWVKPFVPGDMISVIGGTGVGKTAILQNILGFATKLPSISFELELSEYLMAERSAALAHNTTATEIERSTREGKKLATENWSHIWTCAQSAMTVDKMRNIINRAELKMGVRPVVVGLDYIQLMKGGSGKRYERMSSIAEDLKVLAKECRIILFVLSQISRKGDSDDAVQEVSLTDAKDSGSIENSSGLVLGAWKTEPRTMVVRILKNTRGQSGHRVECTFDGAKYRIRQKIHGINDGGQQ